jgi:amidophosphoribosyltransferase
LASPSELVAYNRDPESVAKHIGADSVIYQTLDDLKGACAQISRENGLPEPSKFEVGVFCGNYITPVSDGYFEHLEKIRGESRKLEVMEIARKAVVGGIASPQDVQVAANGVNLDNDGKLVPAIPLQNPERAYTEDDPLQTVNATPDVPSHLTSQAKGRMDISLHNIGDYAD